MRQVFVHIDDRVAMTHRTGRWSARRFLLLRARSNVPSALPRRNAIQFQIMPLLSVLAFIFDIDGTLVDSNQLHVDSWDRAFRQFGKTFPRERLRAQIGKGSDQYLPEFLTPEEMKRFGTELDEYRSDL